MTRLLLRCIAIAALCLGGALAPPSAHAGDVAAGSDVFKSECAECHSVRAGRNKKGPSLFAVVGRAAGTLPGYNYSDALRAARWTWTPEKLHGYLSQPANTANPGTRMKYDGLADPRDLDDLVSYLGTLHP